MSRASDLVELEAMRRLHNDILRELRELEDREAPADHEAREAAVARAIKLQQSLEELDVRIRAIAEPLGIPVSGGSPSVRSSTVH